MVADWALVQVDVLTIQWPQLITPDAGGLAVVARHPSISWTVPTN